MREFLKGASLGVLATAVGLAALSLIDPHQPKRTSKLEAVGAEPAQDRGTSEAAPAKPAEGARGTAVPEKAPEQPAVVAPEEAARLELLPDPALQPRDPAALSRAEPDAAIASGDAAPAVASPELELGGEALAAEQEVSPPLAEAPLDVATRSPQPLAPIEETLRRAPEVLDLHGSQSVISLLELSEPLAEEPPLPSPAAIDAWGRLKRSTPALARPQMEAGLPSADPAGAPPDIFWMHPADGLSEADADWVPAPGEEDLLLPELRESPPPPLSTEPKPMIDRLPQQVPAGRDAGPLPVRAIGAHEGLEPGPVRAVGDEAPSRSAAGEGPSLPEDETILAAVAPPALYGPARPATRSGRSEPPLPGAPVLPLPGLARDPSRSDAAPRPFDPAGSALSLYAAKATEIPGRPPLALVLLDEGDSAPDTASLATLPYKLSIAILADRPDVAAAMRAYRDAGHEVVLLAPISEGASAMQAAAQMQAYLESAPEVVAVLEAAPGSLSADWQTAAQILAKLSVGGQGILLREAGISAAGSLAKVMSQPSATIFRDIDGQGQDVRAIQRFIDQAAFRAAQNNGVVVLGRLRPQTLTALARWQMAARAGTVSVVPLSALLRQD